MKRSEAVRKRRLEQKLAEKAPPGLPKHIKHLLLLFLLLALVIGNLIWLRAKAR
ncbi:MAG: hypothetical protein U1G05_02135 [Kiritimatiellia bacterium]